MYFWGAKHNGDGLMRSMRSARARGRTVGTGNMGLHGRRFNNPLGPRYYDRRSSPTSSRPSSESTVFHYDARSKKPTISTRTPSPMALTANTCHALTVVTASPASYREFAHSHRRHYVCRHTACWSIHYSIVHYDSLMVCSRLAREIGRFNRMHWHGDWQAMRIAWWRARPP